MIQGACILPNGNIASWSGDATIRLWSQAGSLLSTLTGHTDYILGALQLKESQLLSWSFDGTLRIWDTNKFNCIGVLEGGGGRISGALIRDDGSILYYSKDKKLRTWDPSQNTPSGCWSPTEQPTLWAAYQNRKKRAKNLNPWGGTRSTLMYQTAKENVCWHGDGHWTPLHGLGETLLGRNDKHLVFLQLYHGKRRVRVAEMKNLLSSDLS